MNSSTPKLVLFVDRIGAYAIWGLMDFVAQALIEKGQRVAYVRMADRSGREPLIAPEGVEVYDVCHRAKEKGKVSQLYAFFREFGALLTELEPAVVHTNFAFPGALARWQAKRRGVPLVVTTHHELYESMGRNLRWLSDMTRSKVDKSVYVSRTVARSYSVADESLETGPRQKDFLIYNGVAIEKISAVVETETETKPRKIVCAARFVPEKQIDVLIKALPAVKARFPELSLRLIGDGPLRANFEQLAEDLGVAGCVEMPGWAKHEEVIAEMAAPEAVVICASGGKEGFGLALVEAMICGRPVVASQIPVFQEVMGEYDNGTFYRVGDPEDLAEQLCQIFAKEQVYSGAGLKRAEEHFSSQKMAAEYLNLYGI